MDDLDFLHPCHGNNKNYSFSFGQWVKCILNGEHKRRENWIPERDGVCFDWHCKLCGKYKDTF